MSARVAAKDWSATPLGPADQWPRSLRTVVQMLLAHPFPTILLWGPDLIQVYNDAYLPIAGGKHPAALGQATRECWPEAWGINGPIFETVMNRGESLYFEDLSIPIRRTAGAVEDASFTLSYSPVEDDGGKVGGVLVTVFETTAKVDAERAGATNASDRERLMQELEAERARLAEVFNRSPSFMAVLRGPRHVFELANERYYELVGHRAILGKAVREALPEVEGQGFFELLDRVYATGEAFVGRDVRLMIARRPGQPPEERYVEFVYQATRGADGAVDGVFAHGIDLTEHKRAEAALRESEERFRAAFDQSVVGMALTDLDGRIRQANRAFCDMVGRGEEELVGRDSSWFTYPEDVARNVDAVGRLKARQAPSSVWEKRYVRPDGAVVYAQANVSSVRDAAGTAVALIAIVQDVTERKRAERELRESERRFRELADAMPQIVFAARPDGHVDYFNRRWYEYTGLPEGETGFESWRHVHLPEGLERVGKVWAEALRTGTPYEIEYRLRRADGAYRWHLGRALPVRDGEGRIVRWFGTNTDIHDHKLTEQRLRDESDVVETVNLVGRTVAAELDLQKLVQTVTDATTRLTRAQMGAFFYNVTDDNGQSYSLYTLSGVPREAFEKFPMPRNTAVFGPTFRGEGIMRMADVTKDARYGKSAPYHGMPKGHVPVRSYLAAPVVSRSGEVVGGLFFGHAEAGVFTERDERIVQGIAAQAAVGIDNARLYDALRSSNRATARNLAQLQAVVGSMDEGVILANANGDLVDWNRAALAMHGYRTPGEARKTLGELHEAFDVRTADGQRVPVGDWPMARVLRGERFSNWEVHLYRKDTGTDATISYSGTPVRDPDGVQVLALLTLHDVTDERRAQAALRENEARLQLAVSIARMGTFVIDLRTDAVTVNDPGRAIYGWAADEPLTFAKVQDHFHPDDRDAVLRQVGEAFDPSGPGEFEVVQRIFRTDGAARWIRVRGRGIFEESDGGRRAVRCVGTYIDITAQKEAEERREELLEAERNARLEAERSGRMKDEFLATLSHELRTPLNAIVGWSQVLKGSADGSDEDLAEGLATIERNARAQAQIIEDLLDMSRITSGKIRLDVQTIDLADVVRASVETVRPAADGKGIRLHVILDPQAGPVRGDPSRLQQVFWNLLSNAVKFTPRGGRVQVALERVNSHLEASVTDTGEGIRPDFLPYVFDRFRQADASTTRRHGGLGLGLSIVKQLVELHGGSIRVKSGGAGQGSTFTVALPLTVVHPEADDEAQRRHPQAGASAAALRDEACVRMGGVRVLVVDDEPDARSLVKRLLEDCEAEVVMAASAAEAMERLRSARFDVLVSDIGMPGEDGYSLIRRVRGLPVEAGGTIPALALTAYARSEDRMRAVRAGFQMHVVKPVDAAELITMVASLAGRVGE
jgi:PAS domain S-box-containing protein